VTLPVARAGVSGEGREARVTAEHVEAARDATTLSRSRHVPSEEAR